jgi:cell division protein FtsW (lipid II flippase)
VFEYIIELVILSIFVSLFAKWVKLIPRYPKKRYAIIQEAANAILMTIFLTILFNIDMRPSWIILFIMILFVLWVSVKFTDNLVKRREGIDVGKHSNDKMEERV